VHVQVKHKLDGTSIDVHYRKVGQDQSGRDLYEYAGQGVFPAAGNL
jgi:hypothetical protein